MSQEQDITGPSEGMLVPLQGLTALQIFAPGAVDPLLDKIRKEVRSVSTDISTPTGRKAIASLAYKVARSKTFLDETGKELVSEWKARANTVDAERRRIREELDALKDEVRKPLDDYEAAQAARIAGHEEALTTIARASEFDGEPSCLDIRQRIESLPDLDARDWQEFANRAADARGRALATLEQRLAAAEKAEAEAAEQARLAAEAAELARLEALRIQREREERIAAEAAEAARLEAERIAREAAEEEARRVEEARAAEQRRVEAERIAAQEREEAAARAAAEERERIERERQAAEDRAAQAEADRAAAEDRARKEAEEAERRAEQARVDAERREKEAAETAAQRERERIDDERRAEAAETAKREANKAHRAKINNAALAAFIEAGLPEDMAKLAITAIARDAIPHVKITY